MFLVHSSPVVGGILHPSFIDGQLRLWEIEWLAQGHTVCGGRSLAWFCPALSAMVLPSLGKYKTLTCGSRTIIPSRSLLQQSYMHLLISAAISVPLPLSPVFLHR